MAEDNLIVHEKGDARGSLASGKASENSFSHRVLEKGVESIYNQGE